MQGPLNSDPTNTSTPISYTPSVLNWAKRQRFLINSTHSGSALKQPKPAFLVRQTGLRSTGDRKGMYLTGEISTADWEEGAKVEKNAGS